MPREVAGLCFEMQSEPVIRKDTNYVLAKIVPIVGHEKGPALAVLKPVCARSVEHERAAGAYGLDAFDLESGADHLRVDYYMGSLILIGEFLIGHTANMDDSQLCGILSGW